MERQLIENSPLALSTIGAYANWHEALVMISWAYRRQNRVEGGGKVFEETILITRVRTVKVTNSRGTYSICLEVEANGIRQILLHEDGKAATMWVENSAQKLDSKTVRIQRVGEKGQRLTTE